MGVEDSEERTRKYADKVGSDLAKTFAYVKDQLIILRYEWRIFSEWFRGSKERVNLLNEVSGSTALVLQNTLRDRVMIKLSRLTDPHRQGRNDNVTIYSLSTFDVSKDDVDLVSLTENAVVLVKKIRDIRSKRIVHSDKREALYPSADLAVSYRDIEHAIEGVSCVVRYFSKKYLDTHQMLNVTSPYASDEVAFLEVLDLGLKAKKERRQKLEDLYRSGDYEGAKKLIERPDYLQRRYFDKFE